MRLLNVRSLEFKDFHRDVPKYVTTSHRWSAGNEAMISDIKSVHNTDKSGYKKVEGFARCVREHIGYVDWLWIDTCCVNQDSTTEVDEAVNSMFRWYSDAEICLAYLADVEDAKDVDQFRQSEWFKRGWTLQELLAPPFIVFMSRHWQVIGCKGKDKYTKCEMNGLKGPALEQIIAEITEVPECVLHDYEQSKRYTTEQKLAWIAGRDTTKIEDMYYSLLGIFDVRMSLSYGEGTRSARQRLLKKIWKRDQQAGQFQKVVDWLSPPDPETNHAAARKRHEPDTGAWLLQSNEYQNWKAGDIRHLWLYGKAGCGKTVLCSSAIEDIRMYSETVKNTTCAIFYFTFSDNQKQSYEDLLRSLVAQLGWKEPGLSMLTQACEKPNASRPAVDELEKIALACVQPYDELFLLLDALDECPEGSEVRQNVLAGLERVAQEAGNIKMFVTSREVTDVGDCMQTLGANFTSVAARSVNADIERYTTNQLSRDRRLSRLDATTKNLIADTISQRADGM
jgi:Cdc6-like AAA superfamily ATPase